MAGPYKVTHGSVRSGCASIHNRTAASIPGTRGGERGGGRGKGRGEGGRAMRMEEGQVTRARVGESRGGEVVSVA